MHESNLIEFASRESNTDPLSKLLRQGARQLIQQAVEAKLTMFLAGFEGRTLSDGKAAVVSNGYQPERQVRTGISAVSVRIPKVRAKDSSPVIFRSTLVPPYVRKARSLEAALPWLYLKGISTGEMYSALSVLVGVKAPTR